jgi:hypothetical protein
MLIIVHCVNCMYAVEGWLKGEYIYIILEESY